jgi:lipid-A-disaccharide synthase
MKVLFIAGDLSGDQHAAQVARALKRLAPQTRVLAMGGPSLRGAADRFLSDLVSQSVVGFWEPLKKIPWFLHLLNGVLKPALREERPEVVVPVDFFGFNRFTAGAAKAAGSRVFYFVSPQVWASRPGRIQVLKRLVDRMLVIFPFEEALYRAHGVPVTFVGHPLLDELPAPSPERTLRTDPVIGLLPGSRSGEVARHLPLFLAAADAIRAARPEARFKLFAAPSLPDPAYAGARGQAVELVRDAGCAARKELDFALTCSGTATLENALLGVPMAVVYKMSWVTYGLARSMVQVKHIAMANILAERELVPEFVQHRATAANLSAATLGLLRDPARWAQQRRDLLSLRDKVGGPGAAERAARAILSADKG